MSDTTIFVGDFSYLNPTGPIDSMKVGKTRIHFSGNKMYTGYYLQKMVVTTGDTNIISIFNETLSLKGGSY